MFLLRFSYCLLFKFEHAINFDQIQTFMWKRDLHYAHLVVIDPKKKVI